jgi:uncharacterized protein YkwD
MHERGKATRRGRSITACALAALACLAPAPAADARAHRAQACADADLQPTPETLPQVEAAMVCLINQTRAGAGLVPLTMDPRLNQSAGFHTFDMVASHLFAHQIPGHLSLLSRIRRTGYFDNVRDGLYSENIGYGPKPSWTATALVQAWMQSSYHRANILYPDFRDIGVGALMIGPDPAFYPVGPSTVYTTDFGRRIEFSARHARRAACHSRRHGRVRHVCPSRRRR